MKIEYPQMSLMAVLGQNYGGSKEDVVLVISDTPEYIKLKDFYGKTHKMYRVLDVSLKMPSLSEYASSPAITDELVYTPTLSPDIQVIFRDGKMGEYNTRTGEEIVYHEYTISNEHQYEEEESEKRKEIIKRDARIQKTIEEAERKVEKFNSKSLYFSGKRVFVKEYSLSCELGKYYIHFKYENDKEAFSVKNDEEMPIEFEAVTD